MYNPPTDHTLMYPLLPEHTRRHTLSQREMSYLSDGMIYIQLNTVPTSTHTVTPSPRPNTQYSTASSADYLRS